MEIVLRKGLFHVFFQKHISWEEISGLSALSQGNFNFIYEAYYEASQVCIKVPRSVRSAIDQLQIEYSILKDLEHTNIVQLVGFGYRNKGFVDSMFLVLEHVSGGDLESQLKVANQDPEFSDNKIFNFKGRLDICIQIAMALEYMQETNPSRYCYIHRDVKPSNIGLTVEGKVKLYDFGLSRRIMKQKDKNAAFLMTSKIGTPRYMAPEVWFKQKYNSKVDVYSFSILCWEILSLKKSYPNLDNNFKQKVFVEGIRPVCPQEWPTDLSFLLKRCWDRNFQNRPNFGEIVATLKMIHNRGSKMPAHRLELKPYYYGTKKPCKSRFVKGPSTGPLVLWSNLQPYYAGVRKGLLNRYSQDNSVVIQMPICCF